MAINVGLQYSDEFLPDIILPVDPRSLPSVNPFKFYEEVLYLQPMLPPN